VGENNGTIETSHAMGKVSGVKGTDSFADTSSLGGLVGTNTFSHGYGVVENSYEHGNVTGAWRARSAS
jgi:hypothetical protein